MSRISTFVFFDLETTGLPCQERNATKIIELSAVAVLRSDIESTAFERMPPYTKITFEVNPQRPINPVVCNMTGFTNESLASAPLFKHKINTLNEFLEKLKKPVCLVAHNGNNFDYKIFLAEINEANASMPTDLLCVDSLVGFRELLKGSDINYEHLKLLNAPTSTADLNITDDENELMTDDEDDWPDMNLSSNDWNTIDLCDSIDLSCELSDNIDESSEAIAKQEKKRKILQELRSEAIRKIFRSNSYEITLRETKNKETKDTKTKSKENKTKTKEVFTLAAVYKRLLNKEELKAHRAEADCLTLIECVVALKNIFIPWADRKCKLLSDIQPLVRY